MKIVARFAIVLATLLLVTSTAFAFTCDEEYCYEITSSNMLTDTWYVCLGDTGTGDLYDYLLGVHYSLYLFGGGPGTFNTTGTPALGGHPGWTMWVATGPGPTSGFVQPMPPGGGGLIISGEGERNGTKFTIIGRKVDMSNCP